MLYKRKAFARYICTQALLIMYSYTITTIAISKFSMSHQYIIANYIATYVCM